MDKLTFFVAAAVISSAALAQNPKPPLPAGFRPPPKHPISKPAETPLSLYTGRPITPDQKNQLIASVTQAHLARTPNLGKQTAKRSPGPALVTTLMGSTFASTSTMYGRACNMYLFDPSLGPNGTALFSPGYPSAASVLNHNAPTEDTAYLLVIRVNASPSATSHFTVINSGINDCSGGPAPVGQNFTVQPNVGTGEFAYSFIASAWSWFEIAIYSPDAYWVFLSAELTAVPIGN